MRATSHITFVGQDYFHGIMYGEAMEQEALGMREIELE
jgi:hypothetical protein